MSRFYKTSASNPIDWAYELPYKEMLQGVLAKQNVQDQYLQSVAKTQALGDDFNYLQQDQAAAQEQINWLNENIDKYSAMDLTDPTNINNLRKFSRDVAKRWGKTGIAGNIQANYNARQSYIQDLRKRVEKGDLNPMEMEKAVRAWDKSYTGIGSDEAYGGNYNPYSGGYVSNTVDVAQKVRDELAKVEQDIREGKETHRVGMYFRDIKTATEMSDVDRERAVFEGIMLSPEVRGYLDSATRYEYNPAINAKSLEAPMYINQEYVDEATGETKNRQVLNPKSYKAALFQQGLSMKGSTIKTEDTLRNNSWAVAQWKQKKIDDLFKVAMVETADSVTNSSLGIIDLDANGNPTTNKTVWKPENQTEKEWRKSLDDKYGKGNYSLTVDGVTGGLASGNVEKRFRLKIAPKDLSKFTWNDLNSEQKELASTLYWNSGGVGLPTGKEAVELLTSYQKFADETSAHNNKSVKIDSPKVKEDFTKNLFGSKNLGGYLKNHEFVIRDQNGLELVDNEIKEDILNKAYVGSKEYRPVVVGFNTSGIAGNDYIGGQLIEITANDGKSYTIISDTPNYLSSKPGITARKQVNEINNGGTGGDIDWYDEEGNPTKYNVKMIRRKNPDTGKMEWKSKLTKHTNITKNRYGQIESDLVDVDLKWEHLNYQIQKQLESEITEEVSRKNIQNNSTYYSKFFLEN